MAATLTRIREAAPRTGWRHGPAGALRTVLLLALLLCGALQAHAVGSPNSDLAFNAADLDFILEQIGYAEEHIALWESIGSHETDTWLRSIQMKMSWRIFTDGFESGDTSAW